MRDEPSPTTGGVRAPRPRGGRGTPLPRPSAAPVCAAVHLRPDRVRVRLLAATGGTLGEADLPVEPARAPTGTVRDGVEAACAGTRLRPARLRQVVVAVPGGYDARRDVLARPGLLSGWARPAVAADLGRGLGVATRVADEVGLALLGERAAGTVHDDGGALLLWFGSDVGVAMEAPARHRAGTGRGTGRPVDRLDVADRLDVVDRDAQGVLGGTALLAHAAGYRLCPPEALPDGPWADGGPVVAGAAALARSEARGAAARIFLADVAACAADLLAPAVAVLAPGTVVLGGPAGTGGGPLLAALVADRLRTGRWQGRVVPGTAGAGAVLRGAGLLATALSRERPALRADVPQILA